MAAPTPIPRNPDGSIQDLRWAEPSGVIVEPSSGRKDDGWLPLDVVSQGELNWLNSKPFEADRALISQCVPSSSSLIGSWMYRGTTTPLALNGTWSDTGQPPLFGFLSDAAGINTVTVDLWIDPDGNGATGIQARQSNVTPFLFTSTRDHYMFVDLTQSIASITAGITVIDVPVGDPPPVGPAGSVAVWRVETDAVGIVGQEILIPTLPRFKTVSAEGFSVDALAVEDLTVTGNTILGDAAGDTLTVNATATAAADLTVNGILTVNDTLDATMDVSLLTDNTNFLQVRGNSIIGLDAASVHTCNGRLSITNNDAANATLTLTNNDPGGVSLDVTGGNVQIDGDVTLAAGNTVSGPATTDATFGRLGLVVGAPAPGPQQLAAGVGGVLAYDPGSGPELVHYGDTDYAYGTGDQEAATGLLVTHTVATTSETVQVRAGNASVRVIVCGWFQVSALGSTVTFNVQEDFSANPAFTNIGSALVITAEKNGADPNAWQWFRHERVYNPGGNNAVSYRLQSSAQGGASHNLKEVRLRVVNERN